jgi:hypothetical protein
MGASTPLAGAADFPSPFLTYEKVIQVPLEFAVRWFRGSVVDRDQSRYYSKVGYSLLREETGRSIYRSVTPKPHARGRFMETFGPPQPVAHSEGELVIEWSPFRMTEVSTLFDHQGPKGRAQVEAQVWGRFRNVRFLISHSDGTLYRAEFAVLPLSRTAREGWPPQLDRWITANKGFQDILVDQIQKGYAKRPATPR